MVNTESPLKELAEFNEIKSDLQKGRGPVLITGCVDSSKAYLAKELSGEDACRLFITYNEVRATQLAEEFACLGEEAAVYPSKDLLFYKADLRGDFLAKSRMNIIKRLGEGKPLTVIAAVDACLERLALPEVIENSVLSLKEGDEIDVVKFEKRLTDMGYERCDLVSAAGEFAVRGGIIDVYPFSMENPVRIELFGEEIDSMRIFDEETQRSVDKTDKISIFPAKEILPVGEAASLFSYFPKERYVFLDEPERLKEKAEGVTAEFQESFIRRKESGLDDETLTLFDYDEIFNEKSLKYKTCAMAGISGKNGGIAFFRAADIQTQNMPSYMGHFEILAQDAAKWKKEKARVLIYAGSVARAKKLVEDMEDYSVSLLYIESGDFKCEKGQIAVIPNKLKKGFGCPIIRFYALSLGDIFEKEKRRERKHKSSEKGLTVAELAALCEGDYVIHENHGIGIYRGTQRIERKGIAKDFIKISYAGNGTLYIPVTQMNLVQKYADADALQKPKLSRLGSGEWTKTKSRVKKAVKEVAVDLVKLYSERLNGKGYKFSPDTLWQKEFEEQFAYEETEDQLKAINETKADMESDKIMDRLICGDVGFGKTEIAIRAAFKAVQDGKQVAYLVPTTVLAQQHYNTFVQRLADYGPNIELLCRFKSPLQQKKTIERVKKGMTDIVIGTHRLLSKDVGFKNLGLLVIDEEQRFGVSDKEKIKEMKAAVDVISLTATPIPRTLHMSLIGIRDMSIIKEAPLERMPIQTYIMEYNSEIVREAIAREMSRGGQVYYIYNKTNTIADVAAKIKELVPEAEVAFAHGKMNERELEKIMLDFINGEIDVLVSTTIVETGIDISNVNTIIIHDADKFGLSQLYQLRGRVGRSNKVAYAFLLYKKDKYIKEQAEKRLKAIRDFTELGSGIRIAMRDLELRGAGNLLGGEQHGHMEAVGYDMYCKLLSDAVKEAKGERKVTEEFETEIDIMTDAYIPEEYIKNDRQRMDAYRRISSIESEDDLRDVFDEMIDRYGDIPIPVQSLSRIALIKKKAHDAYITEIVGTREMIKLTMYPSAPVDGSKIGLLLGQYKGDLRFAYGAQPSFTYVDQRNEITDNISFLEKTEKLIADIDALMV